MLYASGDNCNSIQSIEHKKTNKNSLRQTAFGKVSSCSCLKHWFHRRYCRCRRVFTNERELLQSLSQRTLRRVRTVYYPTVTMLHSMVHSHYFCHTGIRSSLQCRHIHRLSLA